MNQTKKTRLLYSISSVIELLSILLVSYCVILSLRKANTANRSGGARRFRYFTNLSNIFFALTSLLCLPYHILGIIKGKNTLLKPVTILELMGASSIALTFLTCVFFLGPRQGYARLFTGTGLYLHRIVPLRGIFSVCILHCKDKVSLKSSFFGVIPMALYSIVYLICVIGRKIWEDFYGFTFGGRRWAVPIVAIVMYLTAFLISLGLWTLQRFSEKKNLEGLISKAAKAALDFFFNFLLVSNLLCVKIHKHPISADVA